MSERDETDRMLDHVFDAARRDRTPPSLGWLERVTGDALAVAAQQGGASVPKTAGLPSQLMAILGGWRGMGGLVAAGIAGLAIGIAEPETVGNALWSAEDVDIGLNDAFVFTDLLDEI